LERESDFVRFSGFRAKVRLIPGTGRRRYTGVLCGVENKLIQIQVDNDLHELPIDKIDRAFLDLTLEEYQALGRQISSQIENSQTELQNDQ
jgi:ribosome maturation factor RimP